MQYFAGKPYRVATIAAMKSGLKEVISGIPIPMEKVATIAAMKSGLKELISKHSTNLILSSNHCRDEKRTERRAFADFRYSAN